MAITLSGTSGIGNTTWTTGTRPTGITAGTMGFNTTTGFPEYYDGTTWWQFNSAKTYNASYLIIAGGGAGGGANNTD